MKIVVDNVPVEGFDLDTTPVPRNPTLPPYVTNDIMVQVLTNPTGFDSLPNIESLQDIFAGLVKDDKSNH